MVLIFTRGRGINWHGRCHRSSNANERQFCIWLCSLSVSLDTKPYYRGSHHNRPWKLHGGLLSHNFSHFFHSILSVHWAIHQSSSDVARLENPRFCRRNDWTNLGAKSMTVFFLSRVFLNVVTFFSAFPTFLDKFVELKRNNKHNRRSPFFSNFNNIHEISDWLVVCMDHFREFSNI